jgi:hypothetical protein
MTLSQRIASANTKPHSVIEQGQRLTVRCTGPQCILCGRAPAMSPFTRAALAGTLPAKVVR